MLEYPDVRGPALWVKYGRPKRQRRSQDMIYLDLRMQAMLSDVSPVGGRRHPLWFAACCSCWGCSFYRSYFSVVVGLPEYLALMRYYNIIVGSSAAAY